MSPKPPPPPDAQPRVGTLLAVDFATGRIIGPAPERPRPAEATGTDASDASSAAA